MVTIAQGNLVKADAEALVNTVNCVGHMGRGIALQFKKAFPENFEAYSHACRTNKVRPGRMFVYSTGFLVNPKYIINFPTKRHWRGKSRIEDIEAGLKSLVREIQKLKIRSIAVPPLGCGLGGLDWPLVRTKIERAFQELPDVRVILFEPVGAPSAKQMPVGTKRPRLTPARAMIIRLMQQYSELAYRLTLLETQKLAYFLQESGKPLRLRFQPGWYGPYAHNLNKVLEVLEGHYIRGYGDNQGPDVEIELLPGAAQEARDFLRKNDPSGVHLKRVARVIDGFETPYGMELLSSVHWVATHGESPANSPDEAIQAVHRWNDRKRRMLQPAHIRVAWERLKKEDWLEVAGGASAATAS